MDSSAPGISPQDFDLMTRTVIGEAGTQPDIGKVAVAHTILNRLASGNYGASPTAVVLSRGQFEPWSNRANELMGYGQDSPAYQGAARAVSMAVSGQAPDPTGGAVNFYAPAAQAALGRPAPSWATGPGVRIGAHVFYGGTGRPQQGAATMAQSSDPNEISDSEIETLMTGRGRTASAQKQAAGVTAGSSSAGTPADISDDEIASLMTGTGAIDGRAPLGPVTRSGDTAPPGTRPLTIQPRGAGNPFGTLDGIDPARMSGSAPQIGSTYAQGGDASAAVGAGIIGGIPIVGPALMAGTNRAAATARALTYDEPFSQALGEVQRFTDTTTANHPYAAEAGAGLGNVAAFGALGGTALGARALGISGDNLLMRVVAGGATNAAIGAGDAAVRSGGDPTAVEMGAGLGLGAGALGPVVGLGLETGGNALGTYLSGFRPQGAATNALLGAVQNTGGDLPTLARRLADNPRLSLMDVNPGARDLAQGLAAQPGAARDTLVQAYGQRAGSRAGAVTGAYDDAMGPTPDVLATLAGIRQTAADNAQRGFGAALGRAGPVDLSATIQALDDQIRPGIGQLPSVESGIPLSPVQQRLAQIRAQISTPDGSEVLTDATRLHRIQSDLRTEAETLAASSSGADRLMGRAVMGARNNIVGAIDDATGGTFRPAQQQYATDQAVGDAFNRGLSIFQNRAGVNGLEDRPEYWRAFVSNASPAERDALTLGVRTAADQAMSSVRNAALKGEAVPQIGANLDKLRAVLGEDTANGLAQRMADEHYMALTNAKLFDGSQTQPRQANKLATAVRGIGPLSMEVGLPSFAAMTGNPDTALALGGLALGRRALQFAGQRADLVRNAITADMLSATGAARDDAINRLMQVAGAQGVPTMATNLGQGVNAGVLAGSNALQGYIDPSSYSPLRRGVSRLPAPLGR